MNVAYPAIFHEDERGGYFIEFVDIENCFTEGFDIAHGIEMAEEVLGIFLEMNYLEQDKDLPEATNIKDVSTDDKSFVTMIGINLLAHIEESKLISKILTVSMPQWLERKAEKLHINYSDILNEALITKLVGQ